MSEFKPNKGQLELMDVLAQVIVMSNLDAIDCNKGLLDHDIENSLSQRHQAMGTVFKRHANKVKQDLAAKLEKDLAKDHAQ